MRPYVGAVPIAVMRKNHDLRPVSLNDLANHFDAGFPVLRILFAGFRANSFQTALTGGDQLKSNVIACLLQFCETLEFPLLLAPKRDGDVYHPQLRLAQKPESNSSR